MSLVCKGFRCLSIRRVRDNNGIICIRIDLSRNNFLNRRIPNRRGLEFTLEHQLNGVFCGNDVNALITGCFRCAGFPSYAPQRRSAVPFKCEGVCWGAYGCRMDATRVCL